jgi:hypothetical protein
MNEACLAMNEVGANLGYHRASLDAIQASLWFF